MSDRAAVNSIDALKDFRAALAIFAEDALAALGGVDMEVKRTVHWVQYDRKMYWTEQVKRRRDLVAQARAEVFRRQLAKSDDNNPAMSEQKEALRKAEASLRDAEQRVGLVKKWETALQQAALEYRASKSRISNLAGGDVPRAMALLEKIVESLEAYLRETAPAGGGGGGGGGAAMSLPLGRIAETLLAEAPADEDTGTSRDDEPEPPPAAQAPG
jgi:hypothetical protein